MRQVQSLYDHKNSMAVSIDWGVHTAGVCVTRALQFGVYIGPLIFGTPKWLYEGSILWFRFQYYTDPFTNFFHFGNNDVDEISRTDICGIAYRTLYGTLILSLSVQATSLLGSSIGPGLKINVL